MIQVCEPIFDSSDLENVVECVKTGWVGSGDYVRKFEEKWASYCGMKYGVAVSNGTTALQLAVNAYDFPYDSEIIIPSFTIVSCPLAAIHNDLIPVFVDVDPETWCLDVEKIEESITKNTVAIMIVHIYGYPAMVEKIRALALTHKLVVIEDAAQAHGANYLGKKCGSFGDVSCFSFYSNKIITTGEGGMVLTNSDTIAKKLRSRRNLCLGSGVTRFFNDEVGYNFRLTNIQAAIGYSQIDRIDSILTNKKRIADRYRSKLTSNNITFQAIDKDPDGESSNWMNGILVDDPISLSEHLLHNGVETRPFFSNLCELDIFKQFKQSKCHVSGYLEAHGLYLPSGITLTDNDIDIVSNCVMEFVK